MQLRRFAATLLLSSMLTQSCGRFENNLTTTLDTDDGKMVTGSAELRKTLDNVPRTFETDQLVKLRNVPKVRGSKAQVIGTIMKDHSIACVDEQLLCSILRPMILAHIPKIAQHITQIQLGNNDFSIEGMRFQLLPCGELSLVVDFVIANEINHTGYLPLVLSDTATVHGGRCIVLPPHFSLGSCIRHDCKDGICQFNNSCGCLCHRNAFDVGGCITIW